VPKKAKQHRARPQLTTSSATAKPAAPDLLGIVLDRLSGIGELRQRRMFGGTYIYCDDLFIATVHDDTLYFKGNKNSAPEFIKRGLRPFSYPTEGGVVTLQYYQAPPEVFDSRAAMRRWAQTALAAARQDASSKRARRIKAK
jgi:DNA transformation protein